MGRSETAGERGEQTAAVAPAPSDGRGRVFVDLMSHVERSMHEVAHVFPAVDHLAPRPSPPTVEESERLKGRLSTEASKELRARFDQWCACEREFLEAAEQLRQIHGRESESDYQTELGREIEALRAKRADLVDATERLREGIAHDLDR